MSWAIISSDRQTDRQTGLYVVIPVYNGEEYLRAAVDSVLQQPYKGIELILVDDGSTDGTPALCDALGEEFGNIHVLHQENAGVSAARNAGMDLAFRLTEARGADDRSFLAFLDADDLWKAGTVCFDPTERAEYDILGFSTVYCNSKADRFCAFHVYQEQEISCPERGTVGWIWGGHFGSHLFRIGFLKQFALRFIEGCKYSEDVIFIRQAVFCAARIRLYPEILYVYRRNTESACHSLSGEIAETLALPQYWVSVSSWPGRYPDISAESKERWKRDVEAYAGARVLEAVGTLIESGQPYEDIMKQVEAMGLSPYFDRLRCESLSDWQKPDFTQYHEDLTGFVSRHQKAGRRMRALRSLQRAVPFLAAAYEWKRYPLKEI